jgi:hypothetical protein
MSALAAAADRRARQYEVDRTSFGADEGQADQICLRAAISVPCEQLKICGAEQ